MSRNLPKVIGLGEADLGIKPRQPDSRVYIFNDFASYDGGTRNNQSGCIGGSLVSLAI